MASVSSRPERKLDRLSPRACDDDRQDVIQRQPPFRLPIRLAGDETTFSFSKTCLRPISGAHSSAVPTVSGKDKFFAELETLIAKARELQSHGFDEQEPEAATCNDLIRPFLDALGFRTQNIKPEFKILGDSVDYLLKSARPLMFVEAKSLLDCWGKNLFDKHREQVHRYIQNYRLSPEITAMEQPVKWILLPPTHLYMALSEVRTTNSSRRFSDLDSPPSPVTAGLSFPRLSVWMRARSMPRLTR